jgi:hypothetical protein
MRETAVTAVDVRGKPQDVCSRNVQTSKRSLGSRPPVRCRIGLSGDGTSAAKATLHCARIGTAKAVPYCSRGAEAEMRVRKIS